VCCYRRGTAAGKVDGRGDGGRRDVGILRDRQAQQRHDADEDRHQRDDVRQDRPLDEEARKHGVLPRRSGTARRRGRHWFGARVQGLAAAVERLPAISVVSGATLLPGTARWIPDTTTRSPAFRPLSTTLRPLSCKAPVVIVRCSTTSSSPTTST